MIFEGECKVTLTWVIWRSCARFGTGDRRRLAGFLRASLGGAKGASGPREGQKSTWLGCSNRFDELTFCPSHADLGDERKFVMPVRQFPSKPDLNHLKYQAKDLLKGRAARMAEVAQRFVNFIRATVMRARCRDFRRCIYG